MKRLVTMMLALSFLVGTVSIFAQEAPKTEQKKKSGKKKGSKKKAEEPKQQ